jgi:peptide/nickel transport system ATP-binding protein
MNNEQVLLDIQKLTISLHTHQGDVKVVEGIDFRVPVGSSVGLVGESGSGKSMTALAVMGLLPRGASITAGSIYFDGEELLTKEEEDMEKIRGKKISMIFQSSKTALNPLMTVGDQIARVYELRLGLSRQDAWKKTVELLAAVGISKPDMRARSFAHHLSGGMAQRVMIGLMLACEPQLLIADEPTTGLDVTTEAQILDLIQEMRQTHSITLLLITHDLGLVANNCDLVGVMHAGHLVEYCPVRGLFNKPKHPYTQMFLSSIPRPDRDELSDSNMVGQAPSLLDLPVQGCRFVMRCPFRMERCNQPVPWVEVEPDHKVFCHLFSDGL